MDDNRVELLEETSLVVSQLISSSHYLKLDQLVHLLSEMESKISTTDVDRTMNLYGYTWEDIIKCAWDNSSDIDDLYRKQLILELMTHTYLRNDRKSMDWLTNHSGGLNQITINVINQENHILPYDTSVLHQEHTDLMNKVRRK